jgi:putative spermidine/putrescine transport system ATP-binding protein
MSSAPDPVPEQDAFINFSAVSKSYDGGSYVVYGLNLAIRKGEFLSLLGPSGSGKTTTLMMLAGFETPSKGEITLGGKRLDDQPPHKRDIGMVFQNYALFPNMTIAENIAFPLSVRGVSRAEQQHKVRKALEMIELPHIAHRSPAQLSGGQQQRIALARALVFEPSLVLMDEPLGALDKRLRETMQQEIKRLHRELGVTLVYVTHDQGEALTMSDRVAVFYDGRIQQIGAPAELYENPSNAFVANFVGENNGLRGLAHDTHTDHATLHLPGGARLLAGRCRADLGEGSPATLSVRPERVRLGDAVMSGDNSLPGTVADIVYYGDHRRVLIDLDGGGSMVAKLPNTQQQSLPALGSPIRVGWRADDCKILPPPPKSPTDD